MIGGTSKYTDINILIAIEITNIINNTKYFAIILIF